MESTRPSSATVLEHEPNAGTIAELRTPVRQEHPVLVQLKRVKSSFSNLSDATKLRIKLIASVLMFGSLFVFGRIDLTKTAEVLSKANLWLLSAAVILFLGSSAVTAYRWQKLAQAVGLFKPVNQLLQYCFVGLFFNLFLPSTVGGDVSRCYYLSSGTGKYKEAFYSVLADRVVGIAVLFLFASIGILMGPGASGLPWQFKVPIFLGALGVFLAVPLMPGICRTVLGETHWLTQRFTNSIAQVYWQDRGLILFAILQSILFQVIMVSCHILIGLSLGLTSVPLWYYFVFYPCVAVLGFITPSFNGIGVREGAYTYFLMLPVAGIDKAHAFTYALIWLGMNTGVCLFGGLVYLAGHFKFSPAEAEKLQQEAIDGESAIPSGHERPFRL
jgi:glycosyltransferase 2 family protein